MVFLTKFQEFDPVSGYVPEYPYPLLPAIASRARAILIRKTAEEIEATVKRITSEIERYFSDLKFQAVNELTAKFQNDPDTYQDFFEWDGGTLANGRWIYRSEMDEILEVSTAENSSEVDALKTIIENRDSCFFVPKNSPLPEPTHWPEGRTDELFAALALKLLSECIEWTKSAGRHTLSIAGNCALGAMDAVCFAEHVREVEWLEQFQNKQLLDALAAQEARLNEISEEIRKNFAAEQIDHDRAKKTIRSEQMNAVRHQPTKDAKNLVCQEWEKAYSDFSSAEKAGIHYAIWLEKKTIGYRSKGKLVFYQPRAVTGWLRQYAKEKDIKFR